MGEMWGKTILWLSLIATAGPAHAAINCTRTAGLAVDADGAPDSYRVDGKGLSYTCDGVFARVNGVPQTQRNNRAHWQQLCLDAWRRAQSTGDYRNVKIVGFETDGHGRPIVQGGADPLPGQAFVTTTTVTIPGENQGRQRRYVDANEIPYVVLSGAYARRYSLRLDDPVALYRPATGRIAFAVYADCCSIGEASVRAHQDLGSNPLKLEGDGTRRAKRGIEDPIWMVALTGTHTSPSRNAAQWRAEIQQRGQAAFTAMGGLNALRNCIRGR